MSGNIYGQLGDGGYTAIHRGTPRYVPERMVPNFEKNEGLRFGNYRPAMFLPSLRLDLLEHTHIVIAAGSPVVIDNMGFILPAGYKHIMAAGKGQGPQYTEQDRIAGVKNAQGNPVVAGEFVVDAMIDGQVKLSKVLGVASYDGKLNLNGDVHNPATYQYNNYNVQNGVAVLTNYVLEFPIEPLKRSGHTVELTAAGGETAIDLGKDTVLEHHVFIKKNKDRVVDYTFSKGTGAAGVDQVILADALAAGDELKITMLFEENFYQTPFAGMTTWRGEATTEMLVTFDADSKFVAYVPAAIGDTSLGDESANIAAALDKQLDILGQVTLVDKNWPKQMLDKVVTMYDDRLYSPIINPETGEFQDGTGLDKLPGSANGGVPHSIAYAGGDVKTGVVQFKLRL